MKFIEINNKKIEYKIIRKNVKNINIRIKNDCIIYISANKNVEEESIIELLKNKSNWINKSIEILNKRNSELLVCNFETGDKLMYLGKEYSLVLKDKYKDLVKLEENKIYVNSKNPKKDLITWYYKQSEIVFNKCLEKVYDMIRCEDISYPILHIRKMKSLWGSCIPSKNKITINRHLIKAELELIEFVILHELSHFKYRGHNKSFYSFLNKYDKFHNEKKKLLTDKYSKELLKKDFL